MPIRADQLGKVVSARQGFASKSLPRDACRWALPAVKQASQSENVIENVGDDIQSTQIKTVN